MEKIIQQLSDLDFYKFTMAQQALRYYPNIGVKYGFKNRTKSVRLVDYIDEAELRAELDHVMTLSLQDSVLRYLQNIENGSVPMFLRDHLNFMSKLQLPDYSLEYDNDGEIRLEFIGKWSKTILWETIALSIINELYFRSLAKDSMSYAYSQGKARLQEKIKTLRKYPWITFIEFGTRRRFSREWQDYVVKVLTEELPRQFLGTSNVALAMKYNLKVFGTSAHECDMVYSRLFGDHPEQIRGSHNRFLQDWWEMYGFELSIALTDTFGSEFFFQDMTAEQARDWKGLRHDSGDPIEFGERAIRFYQEYGIDPREKLLIFSDGLNVETIVKIALHFRGRIQFIFGWGTNLTNDLGFKTLSLVIKVIEANGHGTVKLSDNLAKATGEPEDIEDFKRIFDHTLTTYIECEV